MPIYVHHRNQKTLGELKISKLSYFRAGLQVYVHTFMLAQSHEIALRLYQLALRKNLTVFLVNDNVPCAIRMLHARLYTEGL